MSSARMQLRPRTSSLTGQVQLLLQDDSFLAQDIDAVLKRSVCNILRSDDISPYLPHLPQAMLLRSSAEPRVSERPS